MAVRVAFSVGVGRWQKERKFFAHRQGVQFKRTSAYSSDLIRKREGASRICKSPTD